MSGKHKRRGDRPWWVARSMKNAGIALPFGSGLERMVGVSGFATVAAPPVKAPEKPPIEKPSYEPETQAEPEYQQPETSGDDYIHPNEPPVKKGGLHGWQKAAIYAGVPLFALAASYLGFNALRNQQIVPVSTPTPAPTATYTPAPTFTPPPTPTRSAVLKDYPAELADMIARQPWFTDGLDGFEEYMVSGYGAELAKPGKKYISGKFQIESKEKSMILVYDSGLEDVAQKSVEFLKEKLPVAQGFIRVPVNWSFLFVHLMKSEKNTFAGGNSRGGIANLQTRLSDYSGIEGTLAHEGGHLMLDQDVKGTILWYNETMAEIEKYFMLGGEEALDQQLALLDQTRSRRVMTKPLAEFNLDDHIGNPAKGIKATSEHVTRGLDLLLGVRRMVGHSAFEEAVIGITSIIQSRGLTDNDIREQLLLYTPEPLKADVASMYDAAVYGATK